MARRKHRPHRGGGRAQRGPTGAGQGECAFDLDDSAERSERWNEQWRQGLLDELYAIAARLQLPGDYCPATAVPRFVHRQSQGIVDLFGARVEEQPDGNCFAFPLPADPSAIDAVQANALETSAY